MNDSTNSLGAAIGGNVSTGNPQKVGGQDLTPTQSNLQPGSLNILNNTNLRLTDENGHLLNTSTTTIIQPSSSIKKPTNHRSITVFGISALAIAIILVTTWLMTRRMNQDSH